MRRIVAVIALGVAAVGCSTVDPSPKLKAASSAIEAAQAAGAANFPASQALLSKAQGYLSSAQNLIKNGDVEEAIRQLGLASAAADDAKMSATQATNLGKIKDLDAQIADLRTKLGK